VKVLCVCFPEQIPSSARKNPDREIPWNRLSINSWNIAGEEAIP